MIVAEFAIGLFAAAFFIHWLCWRIRRPRRAVFALLIIFHGTLVVGLLAAPHLPWLSRLSPNGPWQIFHVCLFHIAFSLGYTVAYSALALDSPTLTIIPFVAAAGKRGRAREDLLGLVRDEQIVGSRFAALQAAGMIALTDHVTGAYVLTVAGRRWARLFRFLRRVYRLKKGG
jgi:hypothetical protein